MSIPWPVFPVALFGIAVAAVIWNSLKMRRKLGNKSTVENLKRVYPDSKVFTIRSGKPKD